MSLVSSPFVSFLDYVSPVFDDALDFETSALIARLALEDLDQFLGRQDGDSALTDELQLQREHYQQLLASVEDTRRSLSVADVAPANGPRMEALLIAELAAADDQRAVEVLSQGEALPPPAATQSLSKDLHSTVHPESLAYVLS